MTHHPYATTTATDTHPPRVEPSTTRGTLDILPGDALSEIADQYAFGLAGEHIAVAWYQDLGYTCVDTRARCRAGEIDAVLRDADGTIVFLEVKTRRGRSYGGAEAVGSKKLATMRRCAAEWLSRWPDTAHVPVRFDVVEVVLKGANYTATRFMGVEDGAC